MEPIEEDRPRRRPIWGSWRIVVAAIVVLAVAGTILAPHIYRSYTDLSGKREQQQLARDFDAFSGPQGIERYKTQRLRPGAALTRIIIPKLSIDVIVVQGTTGTALRAGAGHYEDTALPGDSGNVAIAGHRTGFGAPFRHLERLAPGDLIVLETPIGRYTYQVVPPFDGHANPWITNAKDFSVIQPTRDASLTLTTTDPPDTSLNRLIVRLKLVRSQLEE